MSCFGMPADTSPVSCDIVLWQDLLQENATLEACVSMLNNRDRISMFAGYLGIDFAKWLVNHKKQCPTTTLKSAGNINAHTAREFLRYTMTHKGTRDGLLLIDQLAGLVHRFPSSMDTQSLMHINELAQASRIQEDQAVRHAHELIDKWMLNAVNDA